VRQNFSVLNKQQPVLKVARVLGNGVCAVADLGNIKKCTAIAVWYSIMVPAFVFA
jgi:hypothetical protein